MDGREAHVVVLPLPTRGHVNPMLHLARLLAARGVRVTYVNTEFNARQMTLKKPGSGEEGAEEAGFLRFVELPDGLPPEHGRAATDLVEFADAVLQRMPAPFERLLLRLSPPPTCVLADTWMTFALDVSAKLRIPHANFWTQSAASFASLLMVSRGYRPPPDPQILGAPFLKAADLNSFVQCYDPSDFMFRFVISGFDRLHESKWILINTFSELEHDTIEYLKTEYPTISIVGPLLPTSLLQSSTNNHSDHDQETLWVEEEECLEWLSKFPPKTVLYVSFGSLANVSQQQIEDIAMGLAASGHPFLWAARVDLMDGESPVFPKGFQEQVKDRAKIISWAPQLKVLSHKAIKGFFTHGGWNSTLESLSVGIPMLGWPYFSDQFMDCKCIAQGWGVGFELLDDDGRELTKEVVQTKVEKLMDTSHIYEKAIDWSSRAKKASLEGGSSFLNLQSFVTSLKSFSMTC